MTTQQFTNFLTRTQCCLGSKGYDYINLKRNGRDDEACELMNEMLWLNDALNALVRFNNGSPCISQTVINSNMELIRKICNCLCTDIKDIDKVIYPNPC